MYDLIIIGAGPAGLTASIYASCYQLKHLIIGREIGGTMLLAPDIRNYPGFESISGKELAQRMADQVKKRGGELGTYNVTRISNFKFQISNGKEESGFEVETNEGEKYQTRAIILATGTERKKLNVPGEVEYTGKGVDYCAMCRESEYQDKVCAIVGGRNSALQAAVKISQAAGKVYIISRGDQLRADPIWIEPVEKNQKIEVLYNTAVVEILGDGKKVTGIKMQRLNNTPMQQLEVDKIFIEIGGVPGTALVVPLGLELDEGGYVEADDTLATNISGIFAAGDMVSSKLSIEQISTAVGLGARAAASVFAYLKGEKAPSAWGESQIKR